MELTPGRTALLIGIALVVGLLAMEVHAWSIGARTVTRKQKALRVLSAAMIIVLVVMMLVGDRGIRAAYGPLAALAYWMLAFGLALMLVVLVLADIREVGKRFGEERKRMYRNLVDRKDEDANTR